MSVLLRRLIIIGNVRTIQQSVQVGQLILHFIKDNRYKFIINNNIVCQV